MELNMETLIPVATFIVGATWMLLVVIVEHLTTAPK